MANICIRLDIKSPYPSPIKVSTRPVFVPGPETDAYDDWIFGGDEQSLIGLVNRKVLVPNTGAGEPPIFTDVSVTPQPYPRGILCDMNESTEQTMIAAFRAPVSGNCVVCGNYGGTAPSGFGSQIAWGTTGGGSVQFSMHTSTGSVGTPVVFAAPGAWIIAALANRADQSEGYIYGRDGVTVLAGAKQIGLTPRPISVGNRWNSSAGSYANGAETAAFQIYSSALAEQDILDKMQRLSDRLSARGIHVATGV